MLMPSLLPVLVYALLSSTLVPLHRAESDPRAFPVDFELCIEAQRVFWEKQCSPWIDESRCYVENMRGAGERGNHEPFNDEKLYDEEAQSFGPIVIRNYLEVLRGYNFDRYEKRFREGADAKALSSSQRPKLDENQFAKLLGKLRNELLTIREADPLDNPVNRKAALRLLLADEFQADEDWR
jgi:hypothetical protein